MLLFIPTHYVPLSVCQVSLKWSVLSRLGGLDKMCRRFLRHAREKYSENKVSSYIVIIIASGLSNSVVFLKHCLECYFLSHLKENSTQLLTSHLLRSRSTSCSPLTIIQSSCIQRYRTPSPGPPVEAVGGLAICDHETRRCLFPGQPPPPSITEPDTIGKKANKHRLKRL